MALSHKRETVCPSGTVPVTFVDDRGTTAYKYLEGILVWFCKQPSPRAIIRSLPSRS